MRHVLTALLLCGLASAQTYHIVTVTPDATAAVAGQIRITEKSNSTTRHYLALEGPDTLGATVRYKFDGTTATGCLNGTLSGGVYTITTSTGCANSVAGGYVITGNSTGPLPVSGDVYGIYSGSIAGTGFGWNLLHDAGVGAVYLVGAQAPSGLNNSFTAYKSNGQMVVTAAAVVDVQTPLFTFSDDVEPESDNVSNFGSLSKRWKKIFGVDAQLDGVSRFGSVFVNDAVPTSGFANGLYASYSVGANWLIAHDGGAGASLQVGAQDSAGANNAFTFYDQSGSMLIVAAGQVSMLTPNFTVGIETISSTAPSLSFYESDQATDRKLWRQYTESSVMHFQLGDDAASTYVDWMKVGRSAMTPLYAAFLQQTIAPSFLAGGLGGSGTAPGSGADAGTYIGYSGGANWIISHDGGAGASLIIKTEDSSAVATSSISLLGASGIILSSAGTILQTATDFGGVVEPHTNNAYTLGAASMRWSKVYAVDLDISGSCTGCPGAVSSVSGSGSGISVSPTTGAVVVSNTGVTALAASSPIGVSGSTGSITVSCSTCLVPGSSPTLSGDWSFGGTAKFTGGSFSGGGATYVGYSGGSGWVYSKDAGSGASLDLAILNTGGGAVSRMLILSGSIVVTATGAGVILSGSPLSVGGVLTLGSTVSSAMTPTTNGFYSLGSSGLRWGTVWANSLNIDTGITVSGTAAGSSTITCSPVNSISITRVFGVVTAMSCT